ncbi:MAG: extracellular solute-binding protein [Alphaproteobacteria bacterium]|nr:extracellular solute-binding protein [Alphaproteobacteria bacterium]
MPTYSAMNSRKKPEGPYETGDQRPPFGNSSLEMARFLDFMEQMQTETERALSVKSGYSEIRMLINLLRNHLSGKLTTSSSLVANSDLSYGTAMRGIDSLVKRGLIVKRVKTATGKSFSLHPSEKMLQEWQELARRSHSLIGSTLGANLPTGQSQGSDYFFGASYSQGSVLPPPSILGSKLSINNDLRILVHADPTFMAMNVLKKQFETIFGVGVRSRALSIDRLRDEILANSAANNSTYDIIACDLPWFGEMAEKGHFLPLDPLIDATGFDTSDFHPEALASARYKGQQYGIPVQTTPELLVYRRDIFALHGLEPPTDIEKTLTAAKKLHDPFGGMSGIAWNAARGTPLGHTFLFVMGAFGQPVLNLTKTASGFDGERVEGENFRPMFDSSQARNAADYFKELIAYSPPGILNMSWYERARCYADGEVGMAYCATLLAPLFESDKSSAAFGNTKYLSHPTGPGARPVAPIGGYALAIPSNIAAERINPIWTALASLTSAQTVKLYIENGSLVSPRFSVSMDPEVRKISPLISIVDDMARSGVLQTWPRPPVPEISAIIAIAGEEMHDMLLGAKTVDQALVNAQNRADALMRKNGHY